MGQDVAKVKKILRQQIREAMDELTDQEKAWSDGELVQRFLEHPKLAEAKTVLLYYGVGREVATAIWQREDCELLAADGETCWMIPRIPERAEQMKPYMGDRIGVASHPDELPAQLVKVTAFREEGAAALLPEFTARWGAKLHVALAGRRWLDVNACTKATGLAALCGLVGIQPREVMAFGDNFNDQPMLDWVGRPYVMRGADPALRALYPAADRPEPVIEALLNALE